MLSSLCAFKGNRTCETMDSSILKAMCTVQAIGFLADFILFLLPAALWGTLTGSVTGTKVFQFIYFFSSFWNQFGPNCTTFLVAGQRLLCTLCMPCRLLF